MALNEKDHWVAILGLMGVAAGYWYWQRKNSSPTSINDATAETPAEDIANSVPLVQGFQGLSSNITTPTQVSQNYNAGYAYPQGEGIDSSSQSFPIPTNS